MSDYLPIVTAGPKLPRHEPSIFDGLPAFLFWGFIILGVLGVGSFVIVGVFAPPVVDPIVTAAQGFVSKGLKFPRDAEFLPGATLDKIETPAGLGRATTYRVTGLVKAANGFGGKHTREYRAVMVRGEGRWRCLAAMLEDEGLIYADEELAAMVAR